MFIHPKIGIRNEVIETFNVFASTKFIIFTFRILNGRNNIPNRTEPLATTVQCTRSHAAGASVCLYLCAQLY